MNEVNLRILEPKKHVGLVVVLTGQGKGKTTSALGMVLRAAGHGLRVCVVQFIKGSIYSGELDGLRQLGPNVEHYLTGKGYYGKRGTASRSEHVRSAQSAIALARERMLSGQVDVLICDEINNALKLRLIDLGQVLDLIDSKPPDVHLVLTGRNAHPEVMERAHTVSEVRDVKHASWQGIEPQKGIDY